MSTELIAARQTRDRPATLSCALPHSPAEHVRRPSAPSESPTPGFTQLQLEALLTAARESPNPCDFTLAAMLGPLGLRILEPQHPGPRGPILLNTRGARMDRHAATRRLRRLAETAGIQIARAHPHAQARRLGHDPARLVAGEETETFAPVPALEQLRKLCQVSQTERRARQAVFFHLAVAVRSRLGQGVHDRCEAYVFADGTLGEADRTGLAVQLPFPARQLSVLFRKVAAGEVWDLTVAHAALGIDERDDLLNVVNVGELVIEPGGRVIVQGNLLVFGCQHLRHPAAAAHDARDYQFGVLPTLHSVDRRIGTLHGWAGAPGIDGGPGRAAGTRPPACRP